MPHVGDGGCEAYTVIGWGVGLVIFFAYAHARDGKASKSASFARVAISLITLTH